MSNRKKTKNSKAVVKTAAKRSRKAVNGESAHTEKPPTQAPVSTDAVQPPEVVQPAQNVCNQFEFEIGTKFLLDEHIYVVSRQFTENGQELRQVSGEGDQSFIWTLKALKEDAKGENFHYLELTPTEQIVYAKLREDHRKRQRLHRPQ